MRTVSNKKLLVNSKKKKIDPLYQRSVILFHSAIKTEKTRKLYVYHIQKFKKHFIIKNEDALISIGEKKIQVMLEDYLLYLRSQNIGNSYCSTVLNALKKFFAMNDITLNWDKLKMMKPEKTVRKDRAYTTEELRILLSHVSNKPLWKAFLHFMASSGVRSGFAEELKMKHLKDMPNGCKAVIVYADHIKEYTTFIHAEAVQALEEYFEFRRKNGEIITPDSWVFCRKDHTKFLPANTITHYLSFYLRNLPLRRTMKNKRYDVACTHGIRKRWDTVVKSNSNVNLSIAEKLFGHSSSIPLDNRYFKPTLEVIFDEYKKVIPDLMISEEWKLKDQIKEKDLEIDELKKKDLEIDRLNKQMLSIQNTMLELEKRLTKS